jgi:Ca-activated chloride channel family protein
LEQTYVNTEKRAIEAVYTFPVSERAAICGFEVHVGDRVIRGEVEERERAVEQYDAAVRDGHGGFLLEQQRPDVHMVNVGNLLPGQAVTVKLEYVEPLEILDRRVRLTIPTVVAPRYATDTGTDPLQAGMDATNLNPPHFLHVDYGVYLEAEIRLGKAVRAITSPSHAIEVRSDKDAHSVRFRDKLSAADRDIVLEVQLHREPEPSAFAAVGPDGDAYAVVSVVPDLPSRRRKGPIDVVFIVDCSGSMEGSSIDQAKSALRGCLDHLRSGDRFNICCFGSQHEWFRRQPVTCTDSSRREAIAFVDRLQADLGGTELIAPLKDLFLQHSSSDAPRDVILLTDGQVSNEPAIVSLTRSHAAGHRFFTFGIGPAPSRFLVRELANATGGVAEFVAEGERIDDAVLRTFSRLETNLLTAVSIDWGVAHAEQPPARATTIFHQDLSRWFARCPGGAMPASVTLRARSGDDPITWDVPVTSLGAEDGRLLACCWARQMIADLGEQPDEQAVEDLIVAISKKYGIVSPLTSFVAVEQRTGRQRTDGCPETRRIPVQVPPDWHGISSTETAEFVTPPLCMAHVILRRPDADPRPRVDSGPDVASFKRGLPAFRLLEDRIELCERPVPRQAASLLPGLLAAQHADGRFDSLPRSVKSSKAWKAAVKHATSWCDDQAASFPTLMLDSGRRQSVLNTIAALWLLRTKFVKEISAWRQHEQRAIRYLGRELGITAAEVEGLLAGL